MKTKNELGRVLNSRHSKVGTLHPQTYRYHVRRYIIILNGILDRLIKIRRQPKSHSQTNVYYYTSLARPFHGEPAEEGKNSRENLPVFSVTNSNASILGGTEEDNSTDRNAKNDEIRPTQSREGENTTNNTVCVLFRTSQNRD